MSNTTASLTWREEISTGAAVIELVAVELVGQHVQLTQARYLKRGKIFYAAQPDRHRTGFTPRVPWNSRPAWLRRKLDYLSRRRKRKQGKNRNNAADQSNPHLVGGTQRSGNEREIEMSQVDQGYRHDPSIEHDARERRHQIFDAIVADEATAAGAVRVARANAEAAHRTANVLDEALAAAQKVHAGPAEQLRLSLLDYRNAVKFHKKDPTAVATAAPAVVA